MMCAKLLKRSGPKRILVVSMTNIGDVVLSCPVIDILRNDFPEAKMDVIVGPKAVSLFEDNPNFSVKVFNKQASLRQKFEWFRDLAKARYDCVVDLRHTALALFLAPKYATPVIQLKEIASSLKSAPQHKKEAHLNRLREVYDFEELPDRQYAVLTTKEDEQFFEKEVNPALEGQKFVVIAPGAADPTKRWHVQGFAAVADSLSVDSKVVFVGDLKDARIVGDIQAQMLTSSLSLAGKINLRQLAFVLKKCSWAMTHDSGVMHLASYFNVPLVALWGPTSLEKYAPWGKRSVVVRHNQECARCQKPESDEVHTCMSFIEIEDVMSAIKKIQQ
jgi:heptosyltransferase-2